MREKPSPSGKHFSAICMTVALSTDGDPRAEAKTPHQRSCGTTSSQKMVRPFTANGRSFLLPGREQFDHNLG